MGWGLTFVRTCDTSACYVTSWVGWGGVGIDVRENLRHTRMLRNFLGWVGWGGDVDVRENLRDIRMLRNFLGWVGWGGDVDVRENLRHIRMLRILDSEALTCVKQSPTNPALLITDGAPCYRSLSAKFGWPHEACNHSKGIFCIQKRMKNRTVLIHTGGVDSMWKRSKSAIPSSLATRVNGHVNPKLMRSIRIWQWRWMNSKENVSEKTGRMLDKRMCS